MDPEFVVADEPVSMLDVSIRTELLRLMLDLRAARGLTYLFITHDLSLAWVIADRIAVMYLGKIMEIGPAEQVIRSPQNPYTRALVSVSPTPEPPTPGERARRTILVGETPDAAHIPTGCRFSPRCPSAFDRCRVEEPPLIDVGEGQKSACWLAEGGRRLPVLDAAPAVPAGRDRAAGSRGSGAARPGLTTRSVEPRRLGQDRPGQPARGAHPATRGTAPRRAPAGPPRISGSSPTATAPCRSRMTATGAAPGSSAKAAAIRPASSTLPISPNGTNGTVRSSAAVSGSALASGRSPASVRPIDAGRCACAMARTSGRAVVDRQVDREVGRRPWTTDAGR